MTSGSPQHARFVSKSLAVAREFALKSLVEAALDQRFPSPALKQALTQYLTITKYKQK